MNCHGEAHEEDHRVSQNHGHGHGHSHDHSHEAEVTTGLRDSLFGKVMVDKSWCLNESMAGSIKGVFKPWEQRLDTVLKVESDADTELLVFVPFNGMVKLKSIIVWGGSDGSAPEEMQVFANRDDLDFDNVSNTKPTQVLPLVDGATAPVEYPVRVAKFGSVRCLSLYFPGCFSEDATTLYYLAFRGEWEELKENPIISVYESKPNIADHKTPANETFGSHTIT
ncbi:hypothetical protein COEREDRAFT_83764 [Coemansia reversa NRRL 1564]|uniref:PITH domain-containing protein n=1 Tax=Coemansia reversa (strain ATCC 12441 / NRRL 1564) TaxID=763665 RepID=A0A2G5B1W8_COERN|nr:hypothetical protein COEREDRAFT_83764 [Coemansia reversa NRRL 1564]|eukprot:PIA12996.1 hypothetical protein COEREDRAFT_83764 [Coemansia reversa NRRL 1564]